MPDGAYLCGGIWNQSDGGEDDMKTILTAEEAAKEIGCRPEKVRMRKRSRGFGTWGGRYRRIKQGKRYGPMRLCGTSWMLFWERKGKNEQNHAEG